MVPSSKKSYRSIVLHRPPSRTRSKETPSARPPAGRFSTRLREKEDGSFGACGHSTLWKRKPKSVIPIPKSSLAQRALAPTGRLRDGRHLPAIAQGPASSTPAAEASSACLGPWLRPPVVPGVDGGFVGADLCVGPDTPPHNPRPQADTQVRPCTAGGRGSDANWQQESAPPRGRGALSYPFFRR